jgi:hypothetical protein
MNYETFENFTLNAANFAIILEMYTDVIWILLTLKFQIELQAKKRMESHKYSGVHTKFNLNTSIDDIYTVVNPHTQVRR